MTLDPTPELLENLYWITLLAVIVSLVSAIAIFITARLMVVSPKIFLVADAARP